MVSSRRGRRKIDIILEALHSSENGLCASHFFRRSQALIKRGTIYRELKRMEQMGLIHSWVEEKHPRGRGSPRRFYHLTIKGHRR